MIDTNVSLFQWPFRRLDADDPASLVANLRAKGVTQAWAGSFEALLHRDVSGVNGRLAEACRRHGPNYLVPFGTVNPLQPGWQEDLRRCVEIYKMPGIRLFPNYHGYKLDDAVAADLLALAGSRNLLIQIALAMEDERLQYPLMRIPPVEPEPLLDLTKRLPKLPIILLNHGYHGVHTTGHIHELGETGNIYFDFANLDYIGCVAQLVKETSLSRVVLGSHYPFYYFESAFLKVREAGLPDNEANAILEGNARRLLRGDSSTK